MQQPHDYASPKDKRGKLKIFLGMVAGVGKTCAMLEDAKALLTQGSDVVIGFIETHGRKKTSELSHGFEIITRKKIFYKNTALEEMDLDKILERKPDLVLVDELAHTNAPGSRHPKRFMDVQEILRAGINVFTSINVQHFESRIDIVKNLSGIDIKESVPDSLLDLADQIELIDLPPDDLLKRLERGEIYPKEKIERSRIGFFKRGTLTALREIALRLTAEKVDREVIHAVKNRDLPEKTKTRDRLLVAIGPSPSATELLRWTRNKAFNLESHWIAAYIDTGYALSSEDRKLLDANIELAKHLGAEIITVNNPSVSQALIEIAREKQVSEIVMGRPQMSFIHKLLAPESPVDTLYKEKSHFAISIITTDKIKVPSLWALLKNHFRSKPAEYAFSFANIAVSTTILLLLQPVIGYRGVGLVFLFPILYQALITGRGPIYLSALLAALSWNFFFITPRFTFMIREKEDIIHLILFFSMASVLGSLTNKVRAREQAYKERERRATFLFEISKILSESTMLESMLSDLSLLVKDTLNLEISFYLKEPDSTFAFRRQGKTNLDSKEESVALWSMHNLRVAGHNTETLPHAKGIYFPLTSESEAFGSIGFYCLPNHQIDFSQKSLLETIARQLSQYIEKQNYFALRSQNRILEESTRLQKVLFSSISHEIKTPLTSIMGAAQTMNDMHAASRSAEEKSILRDILASGSRLTHIVDQLLDMSRLESGKLIAKSEWISIEEVLGLVLGRLESRFEKRKIEVQGLDSLPMIMGDFNLASEVIRNILVNSLQYSNNDSTIKIIGVQTNDKISVDFIDEGPGVTKEFEPLLFERFSRERPLIPGGLGLGLSICQGFMDAMHGSIEAKNRNDRINGFMVRLTFKKNPSPPSSV